MTKRIEEAVSTSLYNARLYLLKGTLPATGKALDPIVILFHAECALRLENAL